MSKTDSYDSDIINLRWLGNNPQELRRIFVKIAMYITTIIPMMFLMNISYAYFQSKKEEGFCINEHDHKYIAVNYTCMEIIRTFTNHIDESFRPILFNIFILGIQLFMILFPNYFNQNKSLKQSIYFLITGSFQLFTTVHIYFWTFEMQVFNKCGICCIICELPCTKNTRGACLPKIAGQLNYWFCLICSATFLLSAMCVVSSLFCLLVDMQGQPLTQTTTKRAEYVPLMPIK